MLVPFVASNAVHKSTYGTQVMTEQSASLTRGAISSMSTLASAGVLFIFQLPAMTAFLRVLFMIQSPSDLIFPHEKDFMF